MAKQLVIVESPTKTKTLQRFLGNGYAVAATMGHLVDLPSRKLGVDIENDFQPEYVNIEGKDKFVKKLIDEAKKAEIIYLAPDPDREGEAIAWHVARLLKGTKAKIKRASFNEITKSAVTEGLKKASTIDMDKVNAQQARRVLDRLVGYKISPFLWKTVCRGLSAGRVQSVALRLVCEREAEITAFVPQEYWTIDVDLYKKADRKKSLFTAAVAERDGEKIEIQNEESARRIESDLRQASFTVASVKTQDRRRQPLPPYATSTLQQDAAARVRFSPKKTMSVAQDLYEGVELGDKGSVGLITYMRTDSTRVAKEAQDAARVLILKEFGEPYCPDKPPVYSSKKRTQDAHEAIRPTYFDQSPAAVKRYLSPDQFKLYTLIWNRFLASQMTPAVIERTTVDILAQIPPAGSKKSKSHSYTLKAGAERVTFAGFLKVYEDVTEENGQGEKPNALPPLAADDPLVFESVDTAQHWTKPPAHYSEATLVRELEANGIGRPSTYAQIIATILARNYVRLDQRRLAPTELGVAVNSILVDAFPELFNVEFTAEMENELDRIEEGTETWTEIMHAFYEPFSASLDFATERTAEIKASHRVTLPNPCPDCGSTLIVRFARNGKFVACSAFPKCRYTSDVGGDGGAAPAETTDQVCEKCGSPMVIKSGRFGRFLACSGYPNCKNTKAIPTGVKCPEEGCDGQLVPRRTKAGRSFYSCSRYPNCKYAVWDRPVPRECPQCGSPFLLAKTTKARGEHFQCPACKHIGLAESTVEAVPA
ncbi:MAG: type I DNA topoisomerase [candidate division Zixibacteria bacterium]|nr:type I DNA topoisomerase [candidate division Zixibacteria bacterium]